MLGEKIYELQGKITSTRVVPALDTHNPLGLQSPVRMETTFQGQGRLLGQNVTDIGTYYAAPQQDGTLFGEGQGIVMAQDGSTLSWHGNGRGKPTGKGLGATWRATVYYLTQSQKFAALNNVPCVIEWEVDENGNAKGSAWEWR